MGINIKHDEYEAAIRQLATSRGLSLTDAIGMAVRHQLEVDAEARQARSASFRRMVAEVQAEVAKLPVLDARPIDELMYDEDGLPI